MNTGRLEWMGDRVLSHMEAAQKRGIDVTLAKCVVGCKELLNRKGSGRIYERIHIRSKIYRNHQASAPGEPPARLTGILQGSIQSREAKREGRRWVGYWGSFNVRYALPLEIGTSRMAARPFLRPTAQMEFPKLGERIQRAFEAAT